MTKQSDYGQFRSAADTGKMAVEAGVLRLILSAFLGVLVLGCSCLASETPAEIDIYSKLVELKPLPKVHYSWGIRGETLDLYGSRLLYEVARITHSLSVAGEWVSESQIDNCVYTCARVNKLGPSILCTIGVNFSPWHRKFGKDLPPTDRGPTYYAELSYFESRMSSIRTWVAKANDKYGSHVKVSAVLLDCERFDEKPGDSRWNDAMREALDAIHLEAKKVFPEARIEWYGRGAGYTTDAIQWRKSPYFTGREIKPSLSCSLYYVPEEDRTRRLFQETVKIADQMGVSDITPWVALACGYRRGYPKPFYWDDDWDYDLAISQRIGADLNSSVSTDSGEKKDEYGRVKIVVFYPEPFSPQTPAWGKHFVAYVRGATDVAKLDGLGYK